MEVIKSAGVYNCHIDDLYKSAGPAEAPSTKLSTEPPHKEFSAHLHCKGQQVGGHGVRGHLCHLPLEPPLPSLPVSMG